MEPLTMAMTFATIASLMASYRSESEASKSEDDYPNFLEWLSENNKNDILELLNNNLELARSIKEAINTHEEKLYSQLARLNEAIGYIAKRMDCFSGIIESIDFKSTLSPQALSIINQLVTSGASYFLEHINLRNNQGNSFILVGGNKQSQIQYDEPQFIEDDILSLVERGYLRLQLTSKGTRRFHVTREAMALTII